MADFEGTLNAILGDSNAMAQIMALAQSLSGGSDGSNGSEDPTIDTEKNPEAPQQAELEAEHDPAFSSLPLECPRKDRDIELLTALRPFLREERQEKLEQAFHLVRMIRLMRTAFGSAKNPR